MPGSGRRCLADRRSEPKGRGGFNDGAKAGLALHELPLHLSQHQQRQANTEYKIQADREDNRKAYESGWQPP